LAAAAAIFLPVATEPVNIILSGAASTSAAPVRPSPVTICTAFLGKPAFSKTSPIFSPTIGVNSDGFMTTVFPAISAIAARQAGSRTESSSGNNSNYAERLVNDFR
jgi:hypothetical protein